MNKTKELVSLFFIFAFVFSIVYVSALTGSLGSSRMILRLEPGESIERYILVKNINDESLNIDIDVGGDLAESLELTESSFVLEPNTEKKVYFTITADKPGTTETKLNVRFSPQDGNGVGLTASVIVITAEADDYFSSINYDDSQVDIGDVAGTNDQGFSFNPSAASVDGYEDRGFDFSPVLILLSISVLLVVVLIGLIVYSNKAKRKRVKGRSA